MGKTKWSKQIAGFLMRAAAIAGLAFGPVLLGSLVNPAQAQTTSGALKVTSFPSGAHVSVDGLDSGKVTPMTISLAVGDHTVVVSISNSGWNPDTRTVTIVSGNNDLSVTLLPILTTGPIGPPGPKGDTGPAGPQGPKGDNGTNGTNGTRPDPPCFDNTNRYVDCGNGTVTDTVTGLIWLKQANCLANATYSAANQAAAGLKAGDCSLTDRSSPGDWRLPTKDEWSATIARAVALGCTIGTGTAPSLTNDAGTACLSVGPSSFAGVASVGGWWSSAAIETDPNSVWVADLGFGFVFGNGFVKGFTLLVWPVRGGPR